MWLVLCYSRIPASHLQKMGQIVHFHKCLLKTAHFFLQMNGITLHGCICYIIVFAAYFFFFSFSYTAYIIYLPSWTLGSNMHCPLEQCA
jgi:hypothetical protein